MNIIRLEEIGSTNDYAKARRADGLPFIVVARRQTGGRGTKGRSFSSDEGGVYLSRLDFYDNFPVSDAFKIMAGASAAVCRTLERFGFAPLIKWPNDVYVRDRKICGILIENVFSGERISSSVVGIGLNVNNRLSEELKGTAVSMREAAGRPFDRDEVEKTLIGETEKRFSMDDYLARVGYMNCPAWLIRDNERIPATPLSVDRQGNLVAKINGKICAVSSAEMSLRIPDAAEGEKR